MPQPKCLFPHDKVIAALEKHGIEVVEQHGKGIFIFGIRELGKEFPVKFLAAKQFEAGIWDIYTVRNLVEELELDEELCDKIDNELTGYVPIEEQ